MNDVVTLYQNKEPRVGTASLWKEFGYKEHRALKKVIFANKHLFESKGKLFSASTMAETRTGRPDESYLLNERQFILLVMLAKNTPETVVFKDRIENEFFRMRGELQKVATPSPYIEQVRQILLLDAPADWVKLYPPEYYQALMQLYGKKFTSNKHTPPFCGQITRRWIYDIVLPPELNNEIDAQRKEEQKHRWFKDKGREILLKQIMAVTGIARQSRDRKEFEARCGAMFKNEPFQLMMML